VCVWCVCVCGVCVVCVCGVCVCVCVVCVCMCVCVCVCFGNICTSINCVFVLSLLCIYILFTLFFNILIYVFSLLCTSCSVYSVSIVSTSTLRLPSLRVYPCFFLSCKANASGKPSKTGHGPHSSKINFVVLCTVCV